MGPINMFGKTIQLLETTMDRRVESHNLISRNISNADTPGYSGTNLEFQKQLQTALDGGVLPASVTRTHPMHMPNKDPKPYDEAEPQYKDTGPVHLDIEMSRLAENNLMFNAMVQLLNKKFKGLKAAISEKAGG
jgi:flagellar basal-body rod protein FlgB